MYCAAVFTMNTMRKKIDGYVKRIEDKPAKIWSILENVK